MVPVDDPRFDAAPLTRARPVVAVASTDELASLAVIPWETLNCREAVLLDPEHAALARRWVDGITKPTYGVSFREASRSCRHGHGEARFRSPGFGFGLAIVFAPLGVVPERPGVTFWSSCRRTPAGNRVLRCDLASATRSIRYVTNSSRTLRAVTRDVATDVAPVASTRRVMRIERIGAGRIGPAGRILVAMGTWSYVTQVLSYTAALFGSRPRRRRRRKCGFTSDA